MEKIWKELKTKDVEFIAVEAFNDTERAKNFIKEEKLTFVFLNDEKKDGEKTYERYGVSAFPTTFIFDKNKKLRAYHLGFEEKMEEKIKEEIYKLLK